jgi:hypothetical protein
MPRNRSTGFYEHRCEENFKMRNSGGLGASKLPATEWKKHMAAKTTTIRKGCDILSRELLSLSGPRAPRSQEQIEADALSRLGFAHRDEDAEVPSLEALIQAVLNSNTEAMDAEERKISQ